MSSCQFPDYPYYPATSISEIETFLESKVIEICRVLHEALAATQAKDYTPDEAKKIADCVAFEIVRAQECANLNSDRVSPKPRVVWAPDTAFYLISKLYEMARGPVAKQKKSRAESFDRRSMKYFVDPQDLPAFMLQVLPHLPLYSFTNTFDTCRAKNIPYRTTGSLITSVYYDEDEYSCYRNRMMRQEGAHIIRIRWYTEPGVTDPNRIPETAEVFIEQKTHREGVFGMRSVKERFCVKEAQILPLMRGKLKKDEHVKKLMAKKVSEEHLQEFVKLFDDVQTKFRVQGLKPKLRTVYHRTAFQNGDDATYRVSIDSSLTMLKERDAEGGWRDPCRTPQPDRVELPFYVVEIKIEGAGDNLPPWVQGLLNSPYLLAVPKFSKYGHGIRTLWLGDNEEMLPEPYWHNQLEDLDIRCAVRVPGMPTRVWEDDDGTLHKRYCELARIDLLSIPPLYGRHAQTKKKALRFETPEQYAASVLGEDHAEIDAGVTDKSRGHLTYEGGGGVAAPENISEGSGFEGGSDIDMD